MNIVLHFQLPAMAACALALACPAYAQTETILHNFAPSTGDFPLASAVLDSSGNLYGTTYYGGSGDNGFVFKRESGGAYTVLHAFAGIPDGSNPQAHVVLDASGNLFGTTESGGTSNAGTVYKIDASGQETVLYSFQSPGPDAQFPASSVTMDAIGNLYGTTISGGLFGYGAVYRIDPEGQESVLYSFKGGADGGQPYSELLRDPEGNLYGTTDHGGTHGQGVVYQLDPAGHEKAFYSFSGGFDGGTPQGGLVRDAAGNLYGTTTLGGADASAGVVFEIDPSGHETVLHSFTNSPADGATPESTLAFDANGNLYGTTTYGGAFLKGTVFKLDPVTHQESLVFSFDGRDGRVSFGPLAIANGTIYGTSEFGGSGNDGLLYRITLAP